MVDKDQQNERVAYLHRGEAINELGFTYKRLLRLIPALFRRAPEPGIAKVLKEQHAVDMISNARLSQVAMDIGQPPGLCVCEEADALVEDVYHADRAGTTPLTRAGGIVNALKAVRGHLIRGWGRLIAAFNRPVGNDSFAIKEAASVQQQEAAQHRQLSELSNELEGRRHDDHGGEGGRRTA
ncbi:MAG: hypothetical protein IPM46_08740 [Flavobacteriales bacterium]|nr:hypothetical protein [Flavobacteriales bacterium]